MVTREDVLRAAALIRAGRLVAFPTETVYGLGANALDPAAVDSIFRAKGRPATSPLIVHVSSREMAQRYVRVWPNEAEVLSLRFWPGPLTIVLPKVQAIPDRVTAGLDTVAIRMPAHKLALELIEAAGVPIAAPSANRFTQLSPTTAGHVRAAFGDTVDLVLDGGPTNVGIESTVLSLAVPGSPLILRPGMVTQFDIEAAIGPVESVLSVQGAHPSPGMHERHYSPRTPLILSSELPSGRGVFVWWRYPKAAAKVLQMPSDPALYASRLYGTLHELDAEGWDFIAVEPVPETHDWAGIRDRLRRAASETLRGPEIA